MAYILLLPMHTGQAVEV